ncbi:unnamed protein product [Paramecium pentaurelia]|uniref:Protein kinase domain-containing protein n=1 Tax=Paramecium pentaurelia TaxID=43138 RepID=A0A8S1VEW1_9CILI|nr:unnamed protein product [Paramecium pentaurelia]
MLLEISLKYIKSNRKKIKNIIKMKKQLWNPYTNDINIGVHLIKSEFLREGKSRYLVGTDNLLIIFEDPHYKQPLEYTTINFDLKFEIVRTAPKMKPGFPLVKLPNAKSEDQVQIENVEKLGDPIKLRLFKDEQDKYELIAHQLIITQWRWFLGKRINQYGFHHLFKVFKKIGKGNFASVYLAERVEDGQQMAIKAFSKSIAYAEENGKEGLINEIKLMRQVDHPNIIKLYEVNETANSLYICLELLEGGQLYEQLKKKVIFTNKEIQTIIKGLLEGLKHIHSKDIMHRDIKLENILFKKQNAIDTVCLADFGLATYVHEKIYLYSRCGTPGFVAPEVLNIKDLSTKYDKVCDIYSLGLVFHLLLTGKSVFPGRSYTTIVNLNKEAKIQWNSSIFELIPKPAFDLLRRMLETDPKQRISAQEALKHEYFNAFNVSNLGQFDDENMDIDDSCKLDQQLQKINDLHHNIDMMRINQLTTSPIKSPNIRATLTSSMKEQMKERIQLQEQIIMKTPIITGRVYSIDDSPLQQKEFQRNIKQESLNFLQSYSKQQQQQQEDYQQEEFRINGIGQIKSNLSKNL